MKLSTLKWTDCLSYDINRLVKHLNNYTDNMVYRVNITNIFPSSTFGFSIVNPEISSLKNRTRFQTAFMNASVS